MEKAARRILKAVNVKLEGTQHLDSTQTAPGLPGKKGAALAAPQVRVAENNPEFAVIEIICCCGTKTSLRCEYAGGQFPADQKA